MANLYLNDRGTSGHSAVAANPYFLSEVIDFNTTTNIATDVFQALNVPLGSVVLNAGVDVLVVDDAGNSGTVALGDGTVVYVAATVPTSTGNIAAGDAVAEMFVAYDAADTLDVTVATGAINAKIRVWAIVIDATELTVTQAATFSV